MLQTFWRESCVKFSTPPHVAIRAHARTDGDGTIAHIHPSLDPNNLGRISSIKIVAW